MTFSLVEGNVKSTPQPDESIIWDDNFTNGPAGWVPIMSSAQPIGFMSLDSSITAKNSRYSLRCDTEDYADGTAMPNWGSSMILKRVWRGQWMKRVRAEWIFAYGSRWGGDGEEAMGPRDIRFGLDTCDFTGARRYFMMRYQISGELNATEGAQRLERWQTASTALNQWATIPGLGNGVRPLAVNENKRNQFRVQMEIDVQTGNYLGLSINGDGFGSLGAANDTTFNTVAGPQLETLNSFRGCLNPTFSISNRIYGPAANNNASACWANLTYAKGQAFA